MNSIHHSEVFPRRRFLRSIALTIPSVAFGRVRQLSGQQPPAGPNIQPGAPPSTVDDDIVEALGKAELSMQFQGSTAEDFRQWRQAFRRQLEHLLGNSSPPKHWSAHEEERTDCDDFIRHSLVLKSEGTPSVPLYLLVPKNLKLGSTSPAVVCLHGHGEFGHHPIVGRTDLEGMKDDFGTSRYDYGRQFVRRGYIVAAPCLIPFGRRVRRQGYGGNDPCAVTFVRMQALGQLPMTSNLRDIRWTIDFLSSRTDVARERIGCAGLSYGGRMTMLAAALDDRVQVAAVSGALNLLQERMSLRHSCGSQLIPGLLKYGDYSEIGSLIAPRPCVWETGSTDSLIVPRWDEIFRDRLRKAYAASQAENQLHFDRFDGGHIWNGQIAFPLFDKILKAKS